MAPTERGVRVVVDAMGGDHAPWVNIRGSLMALEREPDLRLTLVGDKSVLTDGLKKRRYKKLLKKHASRLTVVAAAEVIGMDEPASTAVRKKTKSSIHVGMELVKEAKADAFVSAGNSGAVMAAAMLTMGRLPGIERPAIVVQLPTASGSVTVLDAGANVDCKPEQLVQFAHMGRTYAKIIGGIANPRVGLLSNGEETHKGNELTRATHSKLHGKFENYIGYVEGHDVFRDKADVVVCDGFVGNVMLKLAEGITGVVAQWVRQTVIQSVSGRVGMALLRKFVRQFKLKFHYQTYGAAPLLGIDGIVMIAHGGSSETAIQNGILGAKRAVEQDFKEQIRKNLEMTVEGNP